MSHAAKAPVLQYGPRGRRGSTADRRAARDGGAARQGTAAAGDRGGLDRRRDRRPRGARPDQPGLAGRPRHVLLLDASRTPSPTSSPAFWLDVKCSAWSRRSCWCSAWSSRCSGPAGPPALFPLRLLATVYIDVFRGIPTILLVYLVGFGIPALDLSGLPTEPVVLGGIALALSYGALRRRGLSRRHPLGPPRPARRARSRSG